jgi:putative membrane protein
LKEKEITYHFIIFKRNTIKCPYNTFISVIRMDNKLLLGLIFVSTFLFIAVTAGFGYCRWNAWYGMMGFGMSWIWLLFLALLAIGVILLLSGRNEKSESSALAILEERFARGEITKEQYEETKKILG